MRPTDYYRVTARVQTLSQQRHGPVVMWAPLAVVFSRRGLQGLQSSHQRWTRHCAGSHQAALPPSWHHISQLPSELFAKWDGRTATVDSQAAPFLFMHRRVQVSRPWQLELLCAIIAAHMSSQQQLFAYVTPSHCQGPPRRPTDYYRVAAAVQTFVTTKPRACCDGVGLWQLCRRGMACRAWMHRLQLDTGSGIILMLEATRQHSSTVDCDNRHQFKAASFRARHWWDERTMTADSQAAPFLFMHCRCMSAGHGNQNSCVP
jgi:hypothetical protein